MLDTPSSVGATSLVRQRCVAPTELWPLAIHIYKHVAPMALRNLRDTYSHTHYQTQTIFPRTRRWRERPHLAPINPNSEAAGRRSSGTARLACPSWTTRSELFLLSLHSYKDRRDALSHYPKPFPFVVRD